jgi:hypothetical protein
VQKKKNSGTGLSSFLMILFRDATKTPGHEGSRRFFLCAALCFSAFVAKKDLTTKTSGHEGSLRFLFCAALCLRVFVAKKDLTAKTPGHKIH